MRPDGHCGYLSILCRLTDLDFAVEVKRTVFHFARRHPDRSWCNSDFRRMACVEYVDWAIMGQIDDPDQPERLPDQCQ